MLTVLSLAFAASASAAVLVSNIGQTRDSGTNFVQVDVAQGFTTGSNAGGYTLTSVEVRVDTTIGSNLRVRVVSGALSSPTVVATLTNPSSLAEGNRTFTAPSGTTLAASTTYYVVMDTTTTGGVSLSSSDAEDSGGESGWSIENDSSKKGSGSWVSDNKALLIRVNGSVKSPTITIAGGPAVTEGTATAFTVTASEAPSASLTVSLTVSESSGSDYVASGDEGSKTVTISSGATMATYSVPTQDDNTDEPNGMVTVQVASGTGYTVGSTSSANVTVNDNDVAQPPPTQQPAAAPPPSPVIQSPKGVLVGNADQSLPITLKEGDSVPLTPLEEEGSFVYKKRTIDIPVTRDECTSPGNPAVILSKDIIDRIHRRSREIAFELSDFSPQDPPPGFRVEGCVLEINPGVTIGQGKTETVCLPPAEIEGKSYIHHYNDESGEWEPLLSRIETVHGEELLCVDTDSFSQFRVFVPVIESEEVTHSEDPKDVFSLTPLGEGGSIVYGPGTIGLSVTGDTDPSYGNPAVIVSRNILDRISEITFELSEVSEFPLPGYRLQGFEAEVNLGVTLGQGETVTVCLPYSGGEEDIYYRYNDESEEWEELLESWPDTVNGEDVLCGDAGAVSLSGIFVEETGGCAVASAGGEGFLWRGAVFNLLLIMSVLLLVPGMSRPGVYDRKASG